MPAHSGSAALRRRWCIGGGAVLVILVLVVTWLVISGTDRADQPRPTAAPAEPTTSAASTPPPAPEPPYKVVDDEPLTLPEEKRFAQQDFYLRGGDTYLATFDLTTVKPAAAPGVGMYLGISFSCAEEGGRGVGSIGGTENLLPGEPVTYANTIVLRPAEDGVYRCSVLANAPYDDVAAKGTTVQLDATWSVREAAGDVVETDTTGQLPTTVTPGAPTAVLREDIAAEDLERGAVEVRSSLHVTTCTGVNGSREDGRVWCGPDDIEEAGNDFDLTVRADVLGADGTVCGPLEASSQSIHLDKWRHHHLIPQTMPVQIPADLCGDTVRISVVIENTGPASLVIHESNTSLITVESG